MAVLWSREFSVQGRRIIMTCLFGRGVLAAAVTMLAVAAAGSQTAPRPVAPPAKPTSEPPLAAVRQLGDALSVPSFWDPRRRPERPDLSRITVVRFLTETDYPPFNYAGPDGMPTGFNVELARSICNEIKVACTVQMRRFDTLVDSLANNSGDAVIASLAATPELRQKVDFTHPYYRTPARFVTRRDFDLTALGPLALEGRKVGVIAGTAHEAYLKTLFTGAELHPFETAEAARAALQKGEVDLLFGDGVSLAFWLNGTASAGCCEFRGGPYLESRYFGEGIGIAVRKGNDVLRRRSTGRCSGCGKRAASPTCGCATSRSARSESTGFDARDADS
jgi:polar amino acid transport system substrate-binding protein